MPARNELRSADRILIGAPVPKALVVLSRSLVGSALMYGRCLKARTAGRAIRGSVNCHAHGPGIDKLVI